LLEALPPRGRTRRGPFISGLRAVRSYSAVPAGLL